MAMPNGGGPNRFGPTVLYLGRSWWMTSVVVNLIALEATVSTTGDLGLT